MRPRAVALAALLCALCGCRDGVPLFAPAGPEPGAGPAYQLTFGLGHDRDPRWSNRNDTVLYHTDLFGSLPRARGVVLEIPRVRGTADPALPDVQLGENLLATPAYSPDGARIAFMHLMRVSPIVQCVTSGPQPCVVPQPVLDSAVLRVRRVGEAAPFSNDPALGIKFDGPDAIQFTGEDPPFLQRLHPFQRLHREEEVMLFRPSWSPDGLRIVFSDGLRLRVWRVGDPVAPAIAGTQDAVSPAWSPDGNWIAHTVLERADSSLHSCSCDDGENRRWQYTIGARRLVLIRPDGTGRTVLGDGEDPAWSPNSQQLFVRRGTDIVRVPIQGGAAVVVPNTSGGRMPAVSPDGNWLAFARRKATGTRDYDLWVVSLASQ